MIDYIFRDRMLYTAEGQRRLAQHACGRERDHHLLEAERFEELASMCEVDSAAARRAYRPVRAYDPAAN